MAAETRTRTGASSKAAPARAATKKTAKARPLVELVETVPIETRLGNPSLRSAHYSPVVSANVPSASRIATAKNVSRERADHGGSTDSS